MLWLRAGTVNTVAFPKEQGMAVPLVVDCIVKTKVGHWEKPAMGGESRACLRSLRRLQC